jgi:hypothetical protein
MLKLAIEPLEPPTFCRMTFLEPTRPDAFGANNLHASTQRVLFDAMPSSSRAERHPRTPIVFEETPRRGETSAETSADTHRS